MMSNILFYIFSSKRSARTELCEGIYGLGSNQKVIVSHEIRDLIEGEANREITTITKLKRIFHRKLGYIHSKEYTKASKRNNYAVVIKDKGTTFAAEVQSFLLAVDDEDNDFNCIIYKKYSETERYSREDEAPEEVANQLGTLNSHIKSVVETNQLSVCPINKVIGRAVIVQYSRDITAISIPNYHERD